MSGKQENNTTRKVVSFTIIIGVILYYIPALHFITNGYKILIAAVLGATYGAVRFPIQKQEETKINQTKDVLS